jgi:hypothetical protein
METTVNVPTIPMTKSIDETKLENTFSDFKHKFTSILNQPQTQSPFSSIPIQSPSPFSSIPIQCQPQTPFTSILNQCQPQTPFTSILNQTLFSHTSTQTIFPDKVKQE